MSDIIKDMDGDSIKVLNLILSAQLETAKANNYSGQIVMIERMLSLMETTNSIQVKDLYGGSHNEYRGITSIFQTLKKNLLKHIKNTDYYFDDKNEFNLNIRKTPNKEENINEIATNKGRISKTKNFITSDDFQWYALSLLLCYGFGAAINYLLIKQHNIANELEIAVAIICMGSGLAISLKKKISPAILLRDASLINGLALFGALYINKHAADPFIPLIILLFAYGGVLCLAVWRITGIKNWLDVAARSALSFFITLAALIVIYSLRSIWG